MDSSNNSNQNLIMINDSGGGGGGVTPGGSPELGESFATHHGGRADLISTALDAANICAQDVELDQMDTVVETSAAHALEEGIIYRNALPASSGAANSKVHFISNLTLVAKQPQPPGNAARAGQNIIFLNNSAAGTQSSGASLMTAAGKAAVAGSVSAASASSRNYINAIVSSKAADGAKGKVVNLLQAGPKHSLVSGQSLLPQQQQAGRVGKNVQVLKRLPSHQPNVIGRATGGHLQLHSPHVLSAKADKVQNVVIPGSSLIGGSGAVAALKTLGSGKFLGNGQHQQQQQQHKVGAVAKFAKGGGHGQGATPAASVVSKAKNVQQLSKYQPKVVQVQQQPSTVTSGAVGNFSTGGAPQWRLDMRGRVGSATEEEVLLAGTEVAGIVHRPASGGLINVQGASPTKIIAMGGGAGGKFHQQQQPVLMVSGGGGKAGQGLHTVQLTSPGQYSVIGEEGAQQPQQQHQGGTIKYVNAHGNVVQQQSKPAVAEQPQHMQVHNVIHFGSAAAAAGKKAAVKQQAAPAHTEDVYYVNGTQMNDEMSARLLQSFSQKATSRYVQAQAATTTGAQQAPVKYQYSTQSSFEGPSVLQSGGGAHGPEYFRVK